LTEEQILKTFAINRNSRKQHKQRNIISNMKNVHCKNRLASSRSGHAAAFVLMKLYDYKLADLNIRFVYCAFNLYVATGFFNLKI
jgi:hypothetical protein